MPSITARGYLRLCVIVVGALLGVAVTSTIFAQVTFPPDASCRGCHDDSTSVFTLPSGEELPVRVDLPTLDASPHNHGGAVEVTCTTCHTSQQRYQYPHNPNPAGTRAEFRAEISTACADCHYAHLPFHDVETMEGTMPSCADCHGSHDIATVEEMGESMPANCLYCHTDRDEAWAANFVTPRPGLGVGAEGYAGSTRCNGCHDGLYFTWHDTLHANIIRDPAAHPDAILADFAAEDPDLTFSRDDVAYVIGNRWRQVFLTWTPGVTATTDLTGTTNLTETVALTTTADLTGTTELSETAELTNTVAVTDTAAVTSTADVTGTNGLTGTVESQPAEPERILTLLPAQWTVDKQEWEPLFGDGEAGDNWLTSCAGCHVTGLDPETGGFTEFGVGCESCHGPATAHAEDPENVKPYVKEDDQVCGACHSRGESPDGHPYPTTYRPGDDLLAHFNLTEDPAALWANGSAQLNHQQYMDWRLGSTMFLADDTSCVTCHLAHEPGDVEAQLRLPSNELCVSCHGEQSAIVDHVPFHEKAVNERNFLCTDCHMPKLVSGAQPFDLHSHSLLQPDPQASVEHGGLENMPNACNTCHTDKSETPEWAVQIISYAEAQATPGPAAFFGPGPTPTSPPPPTPVSSVGERAEVELTPPGWWIRWLAFGVIGVMLAIGLVYVGNLVLQRRTRDV